MKLTVSDTVDWRALNIVWLTVECSRTTYISHTFLPTQFESHFFHTFKQVSTQTRKVIELAKWDWMKNVFLVFSLPVLYIFFFSQPLNFFQPASESAFKFLHPSSWDLATWGTGFGSRAYETPLHPGSSTPHLCFLFIPLVLNPWLIPSLLPPSGGLAVRKDLLTSVLTDTNRPNHIAPTVGFLRF